MDIDLSRFVNAQKSDYARALREVTNGRKVSHWIWYIFPQISGLGYSSTARYYSIQSLDEAKAFVDDPYLGHNLIEISNALLSLEISDPAAVMGYPDCLKLRSSMTLFAAARPEFSVFNQVLDKFYEGVHDSATLDILGIS